MSLSNRSRLIRLEYNGGMAFGEQRHLAHNVKKSENASNPFHILVMIVRRGANADVIRLSKDVRCCILVGETERGIKDSPRQCTYP